MMPLINLFVEINLLMYIFISIFFLDYYKNKILIHYPNNSNTPKYL